MAATPPELAPIRAQVYKDPRPKEYFDRFHARSRTREPDWVYEAVRMVTSIYAWTFFRARGRGAEKVPATGPVILAPNHFSFMDHFFARRVRPPAGALHGEVAAVHAADAVDLHPRRRVPGAARLRATRRRSSPRTRILERGGAIVMYCEGGRSRTGELSEQPKRGIGRLALESGAPVVPDGDPRLLARAQLEARPVPEGERALRRRHPLGPRVAEPTRDQQQAVANEIFARDQDALRVARGLTQDDSGVSDVI